MIKMITNKSFARYIKEEDPWKYQALKTVVKIKGEKPTEASISKLAYDLVYEYLNKEEKRLLREKDPYLSQQDIKELEETVSQSEEAKEIIAEANTLENSGFLTDSEKEELRKRTARELHKLVQKYSTETLRVNYPKINAGVFLLDGRWGNSFKNNKDKRNRLEEITGYTSLISSYTKSRVITRYLRQELKKAKTPEEAIEKATKLIEKMEKENA